MKTKHTHNFVPGRSVDVCACGHFRHRDVSKAIVAVEAPQVAVYRTTSLEAAEKTAQLLLTVGIDSETVHTVARRPHGPLDIYDVFVDRPSREAAEAAITKTATVNEILNSWKTL